MSLKTFHILFISLSTLLAFGFGGWCLRASSVHGGTFLVLGVASFAIGVALIIYGSWFMRKILTPEEERKRRRNMFRSIRSVSALGAVWLLSTRAAWACSVCYGEAEGPLIDAARMGVWVLFGLVFFLQICFATFFIVLWKRSRKYRPKDTAHDWVHKGVA